jgi:hydroxymethylglutaryl-CoA lyase
LELKIIETPRDAFQGIKTFIPTDEKIGIINLLLGAGFDTVEAGSFVSPRVIPQMKDTALVLRGLDRTASRSRIMVLVVNAQGARRAVKIGTSNCTPRPEHPTMNSKHEAITAQVDDLLFPFSVSPTFLRRNLNASVEKAKTALAEIGAICRDHGKQLVPYLSMSFGNPYGDPWDPGIVEEAAGYLYSLGHRVIPMSDILGEVRPDTIYTVYERVIRAFPDVEFGCHLHSLPGYEYDKIDAAWSAGVRRFDTVTGGFGGCPMAADHMVSNLNTFALLDFCEKNGIPHGLDVDVLKKAAELIVFGV